MPDRLEIAAGSVEITPQRGVPLAGFEERRERFVAVADPLEANVLMLRQGGVSSLLLSLDVLFVGDRLVAALERHLEGAGVGDCLILTTASHTHFAPNIDIDKPLLGECDEKFCDEVEQKVLGLVDRVLDRPAVPARLRYLSGQADHSVNRRRRVWKLVGGVPHRSVEMRPNPLGPNDQSLHLVRFEDHEGTPLALVWSYACHPVSFPQRLSVTADFPGVVRQELRAQFAAQLPVLFLQGFSGDLRPPSIIRPGRNPARRLAHRLNGPAVGSFSEPEYLSWSRSLAQLVANLAASPDLRELRPALRYQTRSLPLSRLIDGDTGLQKLGMTRLQLAVGLQLFAVTAEVVVEYARRVARLFPGVQTIPVGCAGTTYGYLPTGQMLDEGGYEAGEFFRPFSLSGRFEASLEQRVTELMHELARPPSSCRVC